MYNNLQSFLEKAKEVHGDIYGYKNVKIVNSNTKIEIICNVHGPFFQKSHNHLRGDKCHKCHKCSVEARTMTTEKFIEKSKSIFGEELIYDNTIYEHSKKQIILECRIHGIFTKRASDHLCGQGCQECATEKVNLINSSNTEEFISKCKNKFGDLFIYDKINYVKANIEVEFLCKVHNTFFSKPSQFIRSKYGCPECAKHYAIINQRSSTEEYIEKCISKHGERYDYSKINYVDSTTSVEIVCKKHKESFWINPTYFLSNFGCPKCVRENTYGKYNTDWFIEKSKETHKHRPFKYLYNKTVYVNNYTFLTITCPIDGHGDFSQSADSHLRGAGCPKCTYSKGEDIVNYILNKNVFNFNIQHYFDDCKDKKPLKFDFYIPLLNTCIEYDGEQHFKPFKHFGGEKKFVINKKRDNIKNEYCINNNINLIRVKYDTKNIEEYLIKELDIIKNKIINEINKNSI